jgi:hypothetical protein
MLRATHRCCRTPWDAARIHTLLVPCYAPCTTRRLGQFTLDMLHELVTTLIRLQQLLQYRAGVLQIEPMGQFALDMLHELVTAAGPRLARSHDLLTRLQIDLFAAFLRVFRAVGAVDAAAARLPRFAVTRMAHVVLALYLAVRERTILQVDVFLQARALSTVPLAFCALPGLVHEVLKARSPRCRDNSLSIG